MPAHSLFVRSSAFMLLRGLLLCSFFGSPLLWTPHAEAQQASAAFAGGGRCAATAGRGVAALRLPAEKTPLSLCEGYPLASSGGGTSFGTALALASADFDEDGVPDLLSAFASGAGGSVVIHRGNVAALWPYGGAIQNGTPAAFLPNTRVFAVPQSPDFVVAGDFDGDGHADIVAAARGGNALYFMKGNGHGSFAAAKRVELTGAVTDLIAGEINRVDGLPDIIVGVTGADGSAALVYESPLGALKGSPESFPVSHPITALALGKFSGSGMRDLAIAAGSELTLVRGRDRKLSASDGTAVAAAVVTRQTLGFEIYALATGDFTGRAPSVAALGGDSSVHVLEHALSAEAIAATFGNSGSAPSMQVAGGEKAASSLAMGSAAGSSMQARVAAVRATSVAGNSGDKPEWSETSAVALPGGFSQTMHGLIAARISGSLQDDMLVVDRANSQVHVLSTITSQNQAKANAVGNSRASVARMSLLASMSATNSLAAVLPMRLSQHGLNGLVALQANASSPIVMPQDVAPTAVFTVTNTSDITSASQKNSPPVGSLRAAMENAQAASGDNGGGTYSIVFNIPTTDPGCNATTGICRIQPLSENVPNSLDNFALPPINATLTIDGYTQPGASPNTSTTSDNAKILIQIDGALATTTGGSGLVPFDDSGTVIRGIAFTGWTNPAISNNTASGAEGIEANGVGDFIEGNYFGTADGSTASPNRIGIFADNGPLFGSAAGNVIGGTTTQARNILSGNNNSGILFLSTAYEAQLQGNFIGLDKTGKAILVNPQQAGRSNIFDGAGLNGPYVTIGGTQAGSANVIAGNGTNVDINDLTNGNAAKNSIVVGNLIGTDATGTVGFSGQGYGVSILHNPTYMTIGGTTAAARNVISSNLAGVYVYDNSFYNVVQGNYIGTDITGTVALPNTQQGFISGQTTTNTPAAAGNTVGGAVAGAGNLISGNGSDGVQLNGAYSTSPGYSPYLSNTVQGNLIGTDVTGTKALGNKGNGVSVLLGGTNTAIGGANGGLGNVIANNTGHGVLIDPGAAANGPGVANTTVANIIYANGGAGVRIPSGTSNRVSSNSIYGNTALGIDIDASGPSTNTHCNATNSGANMLQNYPVLTAGTGTNYITATATDPNGNTSEFSKAVLATQAANVLSLLGSFDGKANTNFTIEFFSNPASSASNVQGQTYLGSTTITTDSNCSGVIADPVDLSTADVSVSLTQSTSYFTTGADFGLYSYTATVKNNGPATAHSVTLTDMLPSQLAVSSAYCNVGACQSPITTTQGACTVSGQNITCNLGTMATGATASITIPVRILTTGSITNTVNVKATETDPVMGNNMSSQTANATVPYPSIDHINPTTVLVNSPAQKLDIYGVGFTPNLTATFNGVSVPVVGYVDNQVCGGPYQPQYCSDLQVMIPASQLTAAGTFAVLVSDSAGDQTSANFTVASACTYSVYANLDSDYENTGTNLIAGSVSVSTNVPSCQWTATSSVPWAVIMDNASATGSGTVDVAIAPNTAGTMLSGSITVAGQTFSFTQDAGSASVCSVGLSPASTTAPAAGGAGTINATLSNSSCAPFAEPYPQTSPWITITNKSNLLVASGPVTYTTAPNNGPARLGSIAVGGNVTTITQAAPSCYFTLSSTSALTPATGATGSITVTPTPSSCSWTATSSNMSQVSVTSGATGTGTGTVNYTVAANTGGPITPTITIGNSAATSVFTINQASAYSCTFTVSPTPVSVTSEGTSNVFTVTASYGNCKWVAASNNSDSLSVTQGLSGTGTGSVFYTVGKNTGAARTLTITAGCQTFTINQSGLTVTNPVATLTSLSPSSIQAGSAQFTLTVNGSGFVSGAVVNVNGNARTTTFVSSAQVTATIPASDVATTGTDTITVTNPSPGGGVSSNSLPLTITTVANNPLPTLTALSPSSTTAGSAGFTLTLTGTNFISGSVATFGSTALATSYVSSTQLTATVPASLVASAGTVSVTVTNPSPGGGTSGAQTFTITAANNPVPTLTALSPSSTTAGSAGFTLTLTGTNFISGSVAKFGSTSLTTTYVSATQLTATVPASLVASAGTASVTVTNPSPGGGTSGAQTFTITTANNPTPTLTTLQPSSVTAGAASFTLAVTGTNFVSGATISFGGTTLATTYVSATQLTATVPASAVTTAGTASVTVTNPSPGGGVSGALSFTVNNPTPTLTSISPTAVTAGSAGFTLTVTGSNFLSTSKVNFNGTALTTTYVSATQLTAAVPASSVATVGTPAITVVTPTPGGGASNVLTLTVSGVPTFSLSTSGAQTVAPGATATFTITAAAVNGTYPNAVTFTASGVPAGATASFSPASVTPNASSAQTTLTITAPQAMAAVERPAQPWSLAFLGMPCLGLLLLRKSQRKRFVAIGVLSLGLLLSVGSLTGCGNSGFGYNTVSPQTYSVVVTGTSGTTTMTTTVTLVVNYPSK